MTDQLDRLKAALADRYKLERQLGVGGMATVYLAEDLKHKRKVAIKVLKPELAAVIGADRFVQEIKVTANLQHPNILALYDSGEADSFLYYVMPFVAGESLRDKLNREKQLGIEESVKIAESVAAALDYAHRQDVVHRDIKPENILLHDGQALVADFGIALAISAAAGKRLTETGLSVGTPHYMSPEQASADRELDGRSDVYSLGATLYEMLVGEPPFDAASAQAVVAKILTEQPALMSRERASVPANIDAAVHKALAKLPADRFSTAAGFADALVDRGFALQEARTGTGARLTARSAGLLTIALVAVGLAGWFLGRSGLELSAPAPVTRLTVPVPGGHDLIWQVWVIVSPDGRSVVYPADGMLYLRQLDSFASEPLLGTESAYSPAYSPDGEWLVFGQGSRIRKMPSRGGPVTEVSPFRVNDAAILGLSWGDDDNIAFTRGLGHEGIWRVSASGGEPERLTTVRDSSLETVHAWPQLLPGGNRILFTVVGPSGGWDDASIVVKDLDTGDRTLIQGNATYGRYLDPGYFLYADAAGTILGARFDLEGLSVIGPAEPIESNVRTGWWAGSASFDVSSGGTAAFIRASSWADFQAWLVDRHGARLRQLGPSRSFDGLALSIDERRVAMSVRGANNDDIFLLDVATGRETRFSFDAAEDETPVWSPDGARIAYSSAWTGQARHIYVKEVDTGAEPQLLYSGSKHLHVTSWSPDGEWLLFDQFDLENQTDIFALRVDSADHVIPIVVTEAAEFAAEFSPGGRWIAYTSYNQGASAIFVVSFPDRGTKQQVSANGGTVSRWSNAGELFYWEGTTLMAARVHTGDVFDWDPPTALFDAPDIGSAWKDYQVTADGQRFILQVMNPDAAAREIHVVVNWIEELKRALEN